MKILQKLSLGDKLVKAFPGYLLKGLMMGSLLEKQLSANGTININQLNAYFNKASKVEREVANKVLTEKFSGLKAIDYNLFKKDVQDELIGSYTRVPLTKWADYGMDRLGINIPSIPNNFLEFLLLLVNKFPDRFIKEGTTGIYDKKLESSINPWNMHDYDDLLKSMRPELKVNTFTFESPRIPYGRITHYAGTPIGHSRTYTTPELPEVLHVMESLSDWGQHPFNSSRIIGKEYFPTEEEINAHDRRLTDRLFAKQVDPEYIEEWEKLKYYALKVGVDNLDTVADEFSPEFQEYIDKRFEIPQTSWEAKLRLASIRFNKGEGSNLRLLLYLHDNYLQRQLQENLRYAAEHGQSKMRYPTPETAAKIEGFTKTEKTPEFMRIEEELDNLTHTTEGLPDEISFDLPIVYTPERKQTAIRDLENALAEMLINLTDRTYPLHHLTILKKYANFPKLFNSLYKAQNVRTVTDAKGNTWYEVDVPNDYLKSEWLFKLGGQIKKRF